ncbi:uncharacterized protein BJ171DRAFT_524264 [Polychytrium aggregatum]|uniref:uncharacterized protein n=1 Tax=Polychytrium aggregatum TaxID=110093 RepID=UPI0022FDDD8F|nr:uncharacterized protein BJ171DRAFT_524264 [Polychytrium aggregatum]KAI9193690.1 hypothetical protein BJ171DRAFT_524264 [Polychytrium aggregatum]
MSFHTSSASMPKSSLSFQNYFDFDLASASLPRNDSFQIDMSCPSPPPSPICNADGDCPMPSIFLDECMRTPEALYAAPEILPMCVDGLFGPCHDSAAPDTPDSEMMTDMAPSSPSSPSVASPLQACVSSLFDFSDILEHSPEPSTPTTDAATDMLSPLSSPPANLFADQAAFGCHPSGLDFSAALLAHMQLHPANAFAFAGLQPVLPLPASPASPLPSLFGGLVLPDGFVLPRPTEATSIESDMITNLVQRDPVTKKYNCPHPDCQNGFTRRYNLKVHYSATHVKLKNFQCPACCKAFARKGDLQRHCALKHKDCVVDFSAEELH